MRSVVFIAWLLFTPALFAARGMVHTLDGKKVEGEIALDDGAVAVTTVDGSVQKITPAALVSLRVQPSLDDTPTILKGSGNGLLGAYYNSTDFGGRILARVDETVDFSWGQEPPMTGINKDYFSVRWTGDVEAPASGEYRFFIQTDDGGRLWVDKKLLVDQWRTHEQAEGTGRIQLERGKRYDIRMEYFDNMGNAVS